MNERLNLTRCHKATAIVDSAVTLHKELGPGLLKTVYEVILAYELRQSGLSVERQVSVPIEYHGVRFDDGFCADSIVNNCVVVELKSVEHVSKAHKKQVSTYLRLTGMMPGCRLLNFGGALMKDGISLC